MAGTSLQIDDEYCKSMGQYFVKEGNEIEKFLNEYITILERIKRRAIVKGEVADTLVKYISYAKKIKGQVSTVSNKAQKQANKFVSAIDEADQYLF